MKKNKPISALYPHFIYGGDYNPDQWIDTPDVIDEDMRLMKLAHCNTMTLGIFCWTMLEPEEEKYDFSYLDKMIERIGKNGGKVILATPSGAKPAWMAQKYPEILRVDEDYIKAHQGSRHNHCLTSPVYRRKTAQLDGLLAERYAANDTVIAWHISNEYGGECYCELCQNAFREWLKRKFGGDLNLLNHVYCTKFWNHTFTEWSQLEAPSPHGENLMHGLSLDWRRFVSDQTIDFMKNEIAAVKKYSKDKPVTTNFMRFYDGIDYRDLAKELDVVSWDAYPYWHKDDESDEYAGIAFNHDTYRCYKQKPFMLMENTPSLPNWHDINKLKRPGVNRLASLQAVAHGSDTVQYFQWRKSRGNSEKFHGAVVDHCGHENTRVFREVSELGKTLEGLDEIIGTYTESQVAFLYDVENRWALFNVQGFNLLDKKFMETLRSHYGKFWRRGINVDVLGYDADFSKYKLVVCPMMYMVNDGLIDKIEKFVRDGGTFVTTYMAGMADENDLCYLGGFPAGKLKDVFGLWNEEIDSLYPTDSNTVTYRGKDYKAVDYCEIIHPDKAETLGKYKEDFYSNYAAVCRNEYGAGKAYYIAFRDTGEFLNDFYGDVIVESGVTSSFDGTLSNGVVTHSRTDGDNDYVFVGNYYATPAEIIANHEYLNIETGKKLIGKISLEPYESLILKTEKQ